MRIYFPFIDGGSLTIIFCLIPAVGFLFIYPALSRSLRATAACHWRVVECNRLCYCLFIWQVLWQITKIVHLFIVGVLDWDEYLLAWFGWSYCWMCQWVGKHNNKISQIKQANYSLPSRFFDQFLCRKCSQEWYVECIGGYWYHCLDHWYWKFSSLWNSFGKCRVLFLDGKMETDTLNV